MKDQDSKKASSAASDNTTYHGSEGDDSGTDDEDANDGISYSTGNGEGSIQGLSRHYSYTCQANHLPLMV